jgi:hypothetical protein
MIQSQRALCKEQKVTNFDSLRNNCQLEEAAPPFMESQIIKTAISAGETPEIRPA